MPELVEQMYCSQQIVIPPKFPYILKRYCKAAIKTQPYDLLRWSFEYFKALSQRRPPPVKLRLEYPIYSTEGGLTRGCLKVLANQLIGMREVPLPVLKKAWRGFCLDPNELIRVMCLCEVYTRVDEVKFLHFIAVAAGLLTKCLTHTMILLCETLTKEPDGGSAAIPLQDFLVMYNWLAKMDASTNVRYLNGYKEGYVPEPEQVAEEEEESTIVPADIDVYDDYWEDQDLQKLTLINDHVARSTRLSVKMNLPVIGKIERSPSIERESQIERDNYMRERKSRAMSSQEVDETLKKLSAAKFSTQEVPKEGEPKVQEVVYGDEDLDPFGIGIEEQKEEPSPGVDMAEKIAQYVAESYESREERIHDLEITFDEIAAIVDRYKSANYDLGMVAGRQMSTTSGEFIVQHIEREIMDYINEQIAILPDPDLKKKKAKPEEVQMIREILETFLDENMAIIVPEIEEVEEEELPIPEIIQVYAVPGIGPTVDEDIILEFVEYANEVSKVQADVFMPRNIRHFLCPPLEKYVEHKYEHHKEEVATGGTITE